MESTLGSQVRLSLECVNSYYCTLWVKCGGLQKDGDNQDVELVISFGQPRGLHRTLCCSLRELTMF